MLNSDFYQFVYETANSLTNLDESKTGRSITINFKTKFAYRYPVCEIQIPINLSRFHENYKLMITENSEYFSNAVTFTFLDVGDCYYVFPKRQSEHNFLLENDLVLLLIDHLYNMGYKDDENIYHFINHNSGDRVKIYLDDNKPMIERSNPNDKNRYLLQTIASYFYDNPIGPSSYFIY